MKVNNAKLSPKTFSMKTKFLISLIIVLSLPLNVFASDISYQNDTVVDLSNPDTNLTIISGSTASEVHIGSGTVTATLENGDRFTITSEQYHLEPAGALAFDRYCVGDTEYLTLSPAGASTISLEPKQCPNLESDQGVVSGGAFSYLSNYNKKNEGKKSQHDSKAPGKIYSDIDGHFAEEAIKEIWEKGALDKQYNQFRPDQPITRAEALKIALHLFDYQLTDDLSALKNYIGIDQNAWYAQYFATALKEGIVQGYDDKTLRPNSLTTRSEALKMILLAAKKEIKDSNASSPFSDVPEDFWAKNLIEFAYNQKIIQGKSPKIFAPLDYVTRAELAVMARNAL